MKIFRLFFFFAIVLTVSSCSITEDQTTVNITVVDGRTGKPVQGATVSLFTLGANNQLTGTNVNDHLTNTSGSANFAVPYLSRYYVVAQTGTEKNFYGEGYIPVGYFKSQQDIDSSPAQTPAPVAGGVKFKDVNGDGKIDSSDVQLPPVFPLIMNKKNTMTVTMY